MILINPQAGREKKLGYFSHYVPLVIPFGVALLAAFLLARGKRVKLLDEELNPITEEKLEEAVRDLEEPYIFGFSCLTTNIARGYELAKLIKNKYPTSKIIFGGIHPTVLSEEVLNTGHVDIVVRGEGETTLNSLYGAIKNNQDFSQIRGISFKHRGKIIHNQLADLIDLDELPPFPYHLFDSQRYDFGFISTSRGCPYNCIFCSQRNISQGKIRYFDTDLIINQIRLLIEKYNQRYIFLTDDNFVVNKERAKDLCEAIVKNGFHNKVIFNCQTRSDAVDEEILGYLKKANFVCVGLGLETTSERLMKLINKGETVEDNIKAIKLIKSAGLKVYGAFIWGLPTETREERWNSFKLAKKLKIDYVRFNNATPYPGTKLYEMAKSEGRLNIQGIWENLNAVATLVDGLDSVPLAYVPLTTTQKELKKDILRANLYFYLRPSKIIEMLSKRVNSSGWFILPKQWYFKPKEWYYLSRLGFYVLRNLFFVIF